MRALNIKWDTDGNTDVLNELPNEVEIPYGVEEDEVCDYLSDEYGYCVFGFDIEENDGFKGLFIDGTRSGYAPDQCDETMTINQFIEKLEDSNISQEENKELEKELSLVIIELSKIK